MKTKILTALRSVRRFVTAPARWEEPQWFAICAGTLIVLSIGVVSALVRHEFMRQSRVYRLTYYWPTAEAWQVQQVGQFITHFNAQQDGSICFQTYAEAPVSVCAKVPAYDIVETAIE